MKRMIVTMLSAGFLAAAVHGQEVPMAMPGKADTPPAKGKDMPPAATPASTHNPVAATATEAGEVCSTEGCPRSGLIARLQSHWSGKRHACIEPAACCNNNFPSYGSYSPVYTLQPTHSLVRPDCMERDHCFGVGRFMPRCRQDKHRGGALTRLRAWLQSHRACREKCDWKMEPTPYHAPARYYFQPETQIAPCEDAALICPGGRLPLASAHANARAHARAGSTAQGGILDRLQVLFQREKCWGGHCRKEQCHDIPGSHFNGAVRFARDEKSSSPSINSSMPNNYEPGFYPNYGKKPSADSPIQPVSHQSK